MVQFAVGKASYSSYVYVNFRLWHSELYFSAEIEEQDFCLERVGVGNSGPGFTFIAGSSVCLGGLILFPEQVSDS